MKLMMFAKGAGAALGLVEGTTVIDLSAADASLPKDLKTLIAAGPGALGTVKAAAAKAPATAKSAIARALSLLPDDPAILFEAGHVAQFAGEDTQARNYWNRTIALDPGGPSGRAARQALGMMDAPLEVKKTEP